MKCYKAGGPHYGRPNWDEFCWIDPFVCSGCGIDFKFHADSAPAIMQGKICGRRYGNIVMTAYICGCERKRFNLLVLDDDDYVKSHFTVGESDLRTHWPEIAEFYIEDSAPWIDEDLDPVAEEREYWPEWNRKYHRALTGA